MNILCQQKYPKRKLIRAWNLLRPLKIIIRIKDVSNIIMLSLFIVLMIGSFFVSIVYMDCISIEIISYFPLSNIYFKLLKMLSNYKNSILIIFRIYKMSLIHQKDQYRFFKILWKNHYLRFKDNILGKNKNLKIFIKIKKIKWQEFIKILFKKLMKLWILTRI